MTYYLNKTLDYACSLTNSIPSVSINFQPKKKIPEVSQRVLPPREVFSMTSPFVRLAGLSGAAAVALAAYGAHSVMKEGANVSEENKKTFETASKYHLVHSVALLFSSQARYPALTGGLFATGILLFCGPCYHIAIKSDRTLAPITPYGGFCLIFAWLSFLLRKSENFKYAFRR
uniref:Elongation factor 1-alpha n=1 Tax=Strongyloides stercoralis TaxID=6248 RepID=A0AAF5D3Y0_STRER